MQSYQLMSLMCHKSSFVLFCSMHCHLFAHARSFFQLFAVHFLVFRRSRSLIFSRIFHQLHFYALSHSWSEAYWILNQMKTEMQANIHLHISSLFASIALCSTYIFICLANSNYSFIEIEMMVKLRRGEKIQHAENVYRQFVPFIYLYSRYTGIGISQIDCNEPAFASTTWTPKM